MKAPACRMWECGREGWCHQSSPAFAGEGDRRNGGGGASCAAEPLHHASHGPPPLEIEGRTGMSVTAAQGFVASGCHAGVKRRRYDMALLATDDRKPVAAAAVFTQNKFAAPPVQLDRKRLADNKGRAAGVIVNSGNANAGTGAKGLADAEAMAAAAAEALGTDAGDILVCSTGIIGTD